MFKSEKGRTHSPLCDLRRAACIAPPPPHPTLHQEGTGPWELTAYRGHRLGCLGGRSCREKQMRWSGVGDGVSMRGIEANP